MPYRIIILAASLLSCSGNASSPATLADSALRVAGAYPTAVALVVDSCGGSVVQSMQTDVAHTAGATTLSLTHAGSRYVGTVRTDGVFQTTPSALDANGFSYVVSIAGRFTTTGFDATATVDRATPATNARCRYVASWKGTKAAGTNVIPGP
ncbi:MAG: hypothetical protein ABI625_05405 [bacterium]